MRFIFIEGIRRLLQMFFGMEIFSFPGLINLRAFVFRCMFKIGKAPVIRAGVRLTRAHGITTGTIEIGDHVLLASGVDIDFTGSVKIGDYVAISPDAIIETHGHPLKVGVTKKYEQETVVNDLVIGDRAWIGSRAIILSGVKRIGKDAVIGAGAVVNRNVPDGAIISGNPAKRYGSIYDLS